MNVCKCIVPVRHGGTLNSRRAANPPVWLVEGIESWKAPDHPQVPSLKIEVETSQIVLSPHADPSKYSSSGKSSSVVHERGKEVVGIHSPPQGVLPQYWDGIKPNRTVTSMVFKATAST
ncbi:hypothetical protein TNCV_2274381 [Trichonephila clavipes]|nr:hypothetical protein TNCV_2274381 [Trichonephila clavipes]